MACALGVVRDTALLLTGPGSARGAVSLEDASGDVHRNMGFASMAGSWRLEGGMVALTVGLSLAGMLVVALVFSRVSRAAEAG